MSAKSRQLKASKSQPLLTFESRKRKKSKTSSPPTIENPTKKVAMESTLKDPQTPPKAVTSNDLDAMEERITNKLGSQIDKSLKEAVDSALAKLVEANRQSDCHPAVFELSKETRKVVTRVNRVESEQLKLKRRINDLEQRVLENNLILKGVKEEKWEEERDTLNKVYQELSLLMEIKEGENRLEVAQEIGIRRCRRMGRYQAERNRPISLELVHRQDVLYLLDNKRKLNKGIYLDREYSTEVEKKRKTLRPILKAAKDTEKYRKKSRMEDDKVVIKGKHYGLGNLHELPEDLGVFKVTSKEDEETVAFFGELNPLSNFHPSEFTLDNTSFHSSEQFIQYTKAKFFKDNQTADRILSSTSPGECKAKAENITGFSKKKWDRSAKELCTPGIEAKFYQNEDLMNVLVNMTLNKTIIEATSDSVWGSGVPLHKDNCLDPHKWTSQGILGEVLQELRDKVTGEDSMTITRSRLIVNPVTHFPSANGPGPSRSANTAISATVGAESSTQPPEDQNHQETSSEMELT